jgi:glutaminyl-peptide cyclotransferase
LKLNEGTRTNLRGLALLAFLLIAAVVAFWLWFRASTPKGPVTFDGSLAYAEVLRQMEFGPRITGTDGNRQASEAIAAELRRLGWSVQFQEFDYKGVRVRNIIARANVGQGPAVILGAHYDTRRRADREPQQTNEPVPGANDGASGVAVLLELARSVDLKRVPHELWLAFFDAEDNGELDGWDWAVGAAYMAGHLTDFHVNVSTMILVDMIGDADQQIYIDRNSNAELSAGIWATAARLGYVQYFIPSPKYAMTDDHIPFINAGIPAVDIIDFDYPAWHTTQDTADKVSAASLEHVGRTLEAYLESGK